MDVIFSSVGSGTLSNTVTVIYLLLGSVLIKKKKKDTSKQNETTNKKDGMSNLVIIFSTAYVFVRSGNSTRPVF